MQRHALEEGALALFQEVGETGGRVFALQNLILVLFYQGEYAQAHVHLEKSPALTATLRLLHSG